MKRTLSRGRQITDPTSLPLPSGHKEYDSTFERFLAEVGAVNAAQADVTAAVQNREAVREEYPKMVYQAQNEGRRVPKDPAPAAEASIALAQGALDAAEEAALATDATLEEIRTSASFREHVTKLTDEKTAALRRWHDAGNDLVHEHEDAFHALAWSLREGAKRPTIRALRDPLGKIGVEVTALEGGMQVTEVSPLSMAKLRNGQDAEDFAGNPLTWEEADKLARAGRLKVRYSPPLSVGTPS